MTRRMSLPPFSAGLGAAIGLSSAAALIVAAAPSVGRGAAAAGLAVVGGLAVASAAPASTDDGMIRLAVGGFLATIGAVCYLAAVGTGAVFQPPMMIAAVLITVTAVYATALVSFGFTNPDSLRPLSYRLLQWIAIAIVVGALSHTVTAYRTVDWGVLTASLRESYAVVILGSSMDALIGLLVHLCVVWYLVVTLTRWLHTLDFASWATVGRIRKVNVYAAIGGTVLLAVFFAIDADSRTAEPYTAGTGLMGLPDAAAAAIIHQSLFAIEALLAVSIVTLVVVERLRRSEMTDVPPVLGAVLGVVAAHAVAVLAIRFGAGMLPVTVGGLELSFDAETTAYLREIPVFGATIYIAPVLGGFLLAVEGLRLTLGRLYRFHNRGLPAAASAVLFVGAATTGLTGARPSVVVAGIAGAVVMWDLFENAVSITEQLDGRLLAVRAEAMRSLGSLSVGIVSVGITLGTYGGVLSVPRGEAPPLVVVVPVLVAAIVFIYLFNRL